MILSQWGNALSLEEIDFTYVTWPQGINQIIVAHTAEEHDDKRRSYDTFIHIAWKEGKPYRARLIKATVARRTLYACRIIMMVKHLWCTRTAEIKYIAVLQNESYHRLKFLYPLVTIDITLLAGQTSPYNTESRQMFKVSFVINVTLKNTTRLIVGSRTNTGRTLLPASKI